MPAFDPHATRVETISVDQAAKRLKICVGSVHKLIREGVLPATQIMSSAPWQIPVDSLTTERVQIGVKGVVDRRPHNYANFRDEKTLRLPGL